MSFTDYFKLTSTEENNNYTIKGYSAVYPTSTMVLYSKTGTPLAALVFKAKNFKVQSVLTGRPAPKNTKEDYFQGMLDQKDEVFDFTIINLGDSSINFNILEDGSQINEVNCLSAGEAYAIKGNCKNDNKEMVLSGLTKKDKNNKEEKVTVKEDENKGEKKEGLYFNLAVCPQSYTRLAESFREGTIWKCADVIVKKERKIMRQNWGHSFRGFSSYSSSSSSSSRYYEDEDDDSDGDEEDDSDEEEVEEMGYFPLNNNKRMCRGVSSLSRGGNSLSFNDVLRSQAGKMNFGEKVKVNSSKNYINYNYDLVSTPTVLCLSLCPNLKLNILSEKQGVERVKQAVKDFIKNENKSLLDSLEKVYKSDKCVIDLESEADTIIIQCGHQCVNHKYVAKLKEKGVCPVCRGAIVGTVKAFE